MIRPQPDKTGRRLDGLRPIGDRRGTKPFARDRRRVLALTAALCAGALAVPAAAQHEHHGDRHRVVYGTPVGSYPDLDKGTPRARGQARRLWRRTVRAAARRFPSYRAARRLGFVRYSGKLKRPVVFHVRHDGYSHDGIELDPRRPESLVYWWPRRRHPVLIGYMYRMPSGMWPRYAKPLLGWHSHDPSGGLMTHVWLTRSLRTAIANCMPVAALEAANPAYRFSPPRQGYSRESHPCPQPAAAATGGR